MSTVATTEAHERELTLLDPTTGIHWQYRATWDNQTIRCCGRLLARYDADTAPGFWVNSGDPAPHVLQCRQCGRLHEPDATIEII